jgi:peroxiredoxin
MLRKHYRSFFIAGMILLGALNFTVPAQSEIKVGDPLPEIRLPNPEGYSTSLAPLIGEGKTAIVFWTSWSEACRNEVIFLENMKKNNKNLAVMGISFDRKAGSLTQFLGKNDITFPILIDKSHKYIDDLHLLVLPTTFIIQNGVLKKVIADFNDDVKKELEEALD